MTFEKFFWVLTFVHESYGGTFVGSNFCETYENLQIK